MPVLDMRGRGPVLVSLRASGTDHVETCDDVLCCWRVVEESEMSHCVILLHTAFLIVPCFCFWFLSLWCGFFIYLSGYMHLHGLNGLRELMNEMGDVDGRYVSG
jgi:hypothetical protein